MKRVLCNFLIFLLSITFFIDSKTAFAQNSPQIVAPYAVLMDYETGQILYEKNKDSIIYPASTTKAWTAYVVIKNVEDLSQRVLIQNLEPIEGTSMFLQNGESFTIKELLEGLMITSANDAAVVLARFVSGSTENFANLMNEEAKKIGANHTHFNNPHGLPDPNHYTTAYDMALMARQAMSNETFRNIVKMESVTFPKSETCFTERYFINSNKLIISTAKVNYKGQMVNMKYDIVDGIKTGYTDAAGRCLLSSAVKNDMRLISAVYKSNGDQVFLDSRTLLDYGFDNFESKLIVNKDEFSESKDVLLSKQKTLTYQPKYSYKVVVPKNLGDSNYSTKTNIEKIKLPIKKGQVVGSLDIYNEDKLEHSIELVATDNVDFIFPFINSKSIPKILLLIALVAGIGIFAINKIINVKRFKRVTPYSNVIHINSRRKRKYKSIFSNKKNKSIYKTKDYFKR